MKKNIGLIFGHSHTWSIRRALESKMFASTGNIFTPKVLLCGTKKFPGPLVYAAANGTENINPALISALSDFPPKRGASSSESYWLVSAVQGNYYNIVGMMDEGRPFDFIVPQRAELPFDSAVEVVPFHAIVQAMELQCEELRKFYRRLSRVGYEGIIHLGAPPPHPDSEAIYQQIKAEPSFIPGAVRATAAWTRLKLWIVQELVLTELCRSIGVRYRSAPEASRDANGFLKAHLCKDAVHGTAEYSTLVLDDLQQFFAENQKTEQ